MSQGNILQQPEVCVLESRSEHLCSVRVALAGGHCVCMVLPKPANLRQPLVYWFLQSGYYGWAVAHTTPLHPTGT